MALQPINIGAAPNDKTGDPLRNAFGKANANFADLDSRKVEKVAGKGLSSNDFTDAERVKLANIADAATKNLPDAELLSRANHTGGVNGFGAANDMRNGTVLPASSPPSAFLGKGTVIGLAAGGEIGLGALSFGIFRCDAQWTDYTAGWGITRSFESGGRRFVSSASSSTAWTAWKETTPISQLIDSANWSDFISKMWNFGSGYYRSNTAGVAQTYAAGFFSKTSDTWAFMSVGHQDGVPYFLSGVYEDIAVGTWKSFSMGTAARRDVQTAASDDTAGRVMTVGAFGLGGNAVPLLGDVDINTANLRSGLYYCNGSKSGPGYAAGVGGYYGWIRVEDINPGQYTFQTAFDVSGRKWHRYRYAGNWQPWVPVYDGRSVVAPVDSVTQGGVVEYGSNANGTYTKFVGGLLICRHSAALNFFNASNLGVNWTYPSAFIDTPFVTGNVLQKNSAVLGTSKLFEVQAYSVASSSAVVSCLNTGNFVSGDETKGDMQLLAIGRWK